MRALRRGPWLAVLAAGCIRSTPTVEDAPCPCLDGYVCCEATGRCVPEDALGGCALDAASVDTDAAEPTDMRVADASTQAFVLAIEPATAPSSGGVLVSIQGAHLDAVTGVRVAGQSATEVRVVGRGEIQCVLPPAPVDLTWADVVLETPSGDVLSPIRMRYIPASIVPATEASGLNGGVGIGLVAIDVNDDGRLDLAASRADAPTPVIRLSGARFSFADLPDRGDLQAVPYFEHIVPLDLDGRAPLELVLQRAFVGAASLDNTIAYGLGGPSPRLAVPAPVPAASFHIDLVSLDFEGDGDIDLVGFETGPLASPDTRTSGVLWRNVGGEMVRDASAFEPRPESLEGVSTLANRQGLRAADLDADGRVDLVAVLDGRLVSWRGTPEGLVRALDDDATRALPEGAFGPVVADLDADGRLDVLMTFEAGLDVPVARTGVLWLRGREEGLEESTLGAWPGVRVSCPEDAHPDASMDVGLGSVGFADLDLDGDLDLFLPVPSGRCPAAPAWVTLEVVDGVVRLERAQTIGVEAIVRATATLPADFDADGDVDVVVHGWWLGERTRAFRNMHVENDGTAQGPRGRALQLDVRNRAGFVPFGARVELDLDGPLDAPDFAPGAGRLSVRVVGEGGYGAFVGGPVHFGVPAEVGAMNVRVLLPDGPLAARVEAAQTQVSLGPVAR